MLNITFTYGENPCLSIKDSYVVKTSEGIKDVLNIIHKMPGYKDLQANGYTRSFKSEYQEWKAHNFLYRIGYKRDRTGSVDIDQNEPKWRRVAYAILSLF